MTVALDGVPDSSAAEYPQLMQGPLAGWWARAGAFCIDVVFGLGALASLLLVGWSVPRGGWVWWLCLLLAGLVLLAIGVNRLVLPAITGWSVGRAVFGIAVVDGDGARPDAWRLLLRDVAHLLDTLPLFLGWLWPLIDARGRTFADMLARTEVHLVVGPRPDLRRPAAILTAAAATLAVLGATVGYLGVLRPQHAVTKAREQIADEGPRIVSNMLSYTKQSVDEDFARAQSLVTDGYRPQVVEQQNAVRKAGPVDNDYWVTNSAVLSADRDRAAMLMLLQGQRGAAPQQRFITASVRVEFEKPGGQWKIANLTVLAPPKSESKPSAPPKPGAGATPAPAKPAPGKPAAPKPAPAKPAPAKPAPAKPAATQAPSGAGR